MGKGNGPPTDRKTVTPFTGERQGPVFFLKMSDIKCFA